MIALAFALLAFYGFPSERQPLLENHAFGSVDVVGIENDVLVGAIENRLLKRFAHFSSLLFASIQVPPGRLLVSPTDDPILP